MKVPLSTCVPKGLCTLEPSRSDFKLGGVFMSGIVILGIGIAMMAVAAILFVAVLSMRKPLGSGSGKN